MSIAQFMLKHFRHFNAAALVDAANAYVRHLKDGNSMLITLAGAMSTAELGILLSEMIRKDKVQAICCTGANLEEDLFNLVAHEHYQRIPEYRDLTAQQERDLERRGLNRVTDTCIPEEEAIRAIEAQVFDLWKQADQEGERYFPHEYLYQLLGEGRLADRYQIDPAESWLIAACERNLPLFVPGWEDSTLGNIFVSRVLRGDLSTVDTVRGGLEYMSQLASWYAKTTLGAPLLELEEVLANPQDGGHPRREPSNKEDVASVGIFQIGGGIAGDFPICVVPMIQQDLGRQCPYWGYFCQISDSTTSYGSYSGAVPNEKISWGKLSVDTPRFMIESDATIVAPLIFGHVLGY